MSDTWYYVKKIIALVIFIAVLSMMGVATGKTWMIFVYAAFFILVVAGVIFIEYSKRRHFEVIPTDNMILRQIIGAILLLLALVIPVLVTTRMSFFALPPASTAVLLFSSFGVTLLFMAMMTAAVYLINYLQNELIHKILGYALIIVASTLPGLIVSFFDRSTTGIGSAYYTFLAVVILGYSGINLFLKHD